jgi:hypothetical protein
MLKISLSEIPFVRFGCDGATIILGEQHMTRNIEIFVLTTALLLAACTTGGTSTPTPIPVLKSTTIQEVTAAALDETQSDPNIIPTKSASVLDQPDADVIHVRAVLGSDDKWIFHVTVAHPDTGWDDYADGWDVVTTDGVVLKVNPDDPFTRLLLHPHESEQPFTRSQSGITIPDGITQVRVRAHDIVTGFGGQEVYVDLEQDSGEGYQIER